MNTIAIVSGGMDSTAAVYWALNQGHSVDMMSFDYGQRHRRELDFASRTASKLGLRHHIVDLTPVGKFLTGSALTSPDVEVPLGHYAEETMKITVVPNRNAIMLSIAFGVAIARKAWGVIAAVHAGDHFIYPDCRPAFISAFQTMQNFATEGFGSPVLVTPFLMSSKADIARIGTECGTPWADTWSCYQGNTIHCGSCGTCFERREAFKIAGIEDPTEYEATPEYVAPSGG